MAEPKAFASLSSGLLARKGAARPAMRPQGFGQVGSGLDDLGWNDMGFEAPKPALTQVRDEDHDAFGDELSEPALRNPLAALSPVVSPVHDQQAEIADRFGSYTEESPDEEDYVDETAELYDPNAVEAGSEDDEEVEEEEADERPLIQTKASRPVIIAAVAEAEIAPAIVEEAFEPPVVLPVAEEIRVKPMALVPVEEDVAEPAPVAPVVAAPIAKPSRPRQPRAASGGKAKAAFTLRLDGDRHLRLRLACALTGRSAQQLVTDALDQLLGAMPELGAMADQAAK